MNRIRSADRQVGILDGAGLKPGATERGGKRSSLVTALQRLEDSPQRLDHLGARDAAAAKLEDELEVFGGRGKAKDGVAWTLVGLALGARLVAIHQTRGEPPDEVAHPGFTRLAGHLEELRLREDALGDAGRFDFVGNRAQRQELRD